MKKVLAILLSLLMMFSLTACNESDIVPLVMDILAAADSSEPEGEMTTEPDASPEETDTDVTAPDESEDASTVTTTSSDGSDGSYTVTVPGSEDFELDEEGDYTSSEDVALYIATYNHLPDNFMTKKEARELGWNGGGLDDYAYGMCIGGDYFGNNEGLLPKAKGRVYHECDINTLHENKRGAERIVYSNDGLVYYSDDHYETFTLLYGEE